MNPTPPPPPYKNLKVFLKYIGIVIGLFCFFFYFRSCRQERQQKAPPPATSSTIIPPYISSYMLYIEDPRIDIQGSSRKYVVEGNHSDWVSLVSYDDIGKLSIITGNTFRGKIGFNPNTLKGVWTGETPHNGRLQRGNVSLTKNSYGGFDIEFTYDDGNLPCKGKLSPM